MPVKPALVAALVLVLAGCTAAPVTSGLAPTASGTSSNVFAMMVGDCLNDGASADGTGTVTQVPIVKCSASHDSEVIARLLLTGSNSAFPGSDALEKSADAKCDPPFAKFTGATSTTTRLEYTYYYPSGTSWAQGDREVLCVVYDPHGKVTGSLKGKGHAYPKS